MNSYFLVKYVLCVFWKNHIICFSQFRWHDDSIGSAEQLWLGLQAIKGHRKTQIMAKDMKTMWRSFEVTTCPWRP